MSQIKARTPVSPSAAPDEIRKILTDIQSGEPLLSANQLRHLKILTVNGRAPHLAFVYRKFDHGSRGATGEYIKLPSIKGPTGARCTTASAVSRWLAALNGTTAETHADHGEAHRHAERVLETV